MVELTNQVWDAIVIGAGMGGLNCACQLALAGKNVLVLERNGFLGGRCSAYHKEGFTVDYSVHAFGSGDLGPLHAPIRQAQQILKQKVPILQWIRVNPAIYYKNRFFKTYVPLNFKHFWNYFRTAWKVGLYRNASLSEKLTLVKIWRDFQKLNDLQIEELQKISVKQFIDRYTDSKFLHAIFTATCEAYSAISFAQTAAGDYIAAYRQTLALGGGISYPLGGTGAISHTYHQIVEACGGKVAQMQPVDEILINDNNPSGIPTAVGVRLRKDRQEILGKSIIANVNWDALYNQLLQKSHFPDKLVNKISRLSKSLSAIVAHVALDSPLFKEKFIMMTSELSFEEISARRSLGEKVSEIGGFIPIISNIDPTLAPKGKQLVLAGIGSPCDAVDDKEASKELILDFIQGVAPRGVNIRDHIEWMNIFGPRDFDNLFGENGAVIAYAQQVGQVRENRFDSKTPIEGLYHCGDDSEKNLFGIGTELAALSGQKCAELILQDQKKGNS